MFTELKLKQLQFESNAWKRLLCFMMDENVHLKNRITEILKNDTDNNLLEEIENFQNNLVRQDEVISLLRHDTAELDKLLVREIFEDGAITKEINKKLKDLRNNISTAEQQFTKVKLEFNNYLLETLPQVE
ncbi:MAG: hypothetical protein ACXWV6_12030 [Chitinophagaceae bacterium]